MELNAGVFDIWAFQRTDAGVRFLLLFTSPEKATRHFNGGRFWQVPSGELKDGERIVDGIARVLDRFGLTPKAIWAGEHAYLIYNRRFDEMQAIGVYAAEVEDSPVRLDPSEHSESGWFTLERCLERIHFRGLKDGVRSVDEYITGVEEPAPELCLFQVER